MFPIATLPRQRRSVLALTPVALRAPSVRARTERQKQIPGGANSDDQKGPNQVDNRILPIGSIQKEIEDPWKKVLEVLQSSPNQERLVGILAKMFPFKVPQRFCME